MLGWRCSCGFRRRRKSTLLKFVDVTVAQRVSAPALLAELERLTPAELERMAFPRDPEGAAPGEPLLKSAVNRNNTVLVEFLCGRGIRGN